MVFDQCLGHKHKGACEKAKLVISFEKTTLSYKDYEDYGLNMINAFVINTGDKPLTLIQPGNGSLLLDRSSTPPRTPILRWEVVKIGGDEAPPGSAPVARCGTIDNIYIDEIFTLSPGEKRGLGAWIGKPWIGNPVRGRLKFRVTLCYENRPTMRNLTHVDQRGFRENSKVR